VILEDNIKRQIELKLVKHLRSTWEALEKFSENTIKSMIYKHVIIEWE